MKAASSGAIDDTMGYFRSGFFDLGGQRLYVSRTGFTNELGFEIYTDGARTDHLALWDHLMACGAPYGLELSSARAMTIRRIEGGILGNLSDIDTTMTPFEAGLAPFIDMEKGDFIGRSALADRDRRPVLFGLTCQTAVPAAGSVILEADHPVGRITAGVPSPTLGCGVGYARFSSPGDWVGRSLRLTLPNGETHDGLIVDLPFFDKEKNLVRGIDRKIPVRRASMPFDAR
jgi:glycine cleavage system aminomethyltransferase T